MGRGVAEQRSHRRRSTLSTLAQRCVGEPPHDGAAGRSAAPRLGIHLGEEVIWEGDHDLCHAVSIPGYTRAAMLHSIVTINPEKRNGIYELGPHDLPAGTNSGGG
jgi:hypothetical protein